MENTFLDYLPLDAKPIIISNINLEELEIKVKAERKTRHGDYKQLPNGRHQITVNSNLNPYRFLITFLHEIAHFKTYKKYGVGIKPHGKEWKSIFQHLMLPFLRPEIFPNELLPLLAKHFKNPKASSDTDTELALALKQFDGDKDKIYVYQISEGVTFKLYNGRIFRKGKKRRKRYECIELSSGKLYLFNPNAEIELIGD